MPVSILNGVRERRLQPEIMDEPGLASDRHIKALDGLARLNLWSMSGRALWRPLAALARTASSPLHVLDIACGGGDNTVNLARQAKQHGVALNFDACDISRRALDHAEARAERYQVPIRFFRLDVLTERIPQQYDAIICSLFLHHLEEPDAVHLLQSMAGSARRLIVLNDLIRCRRGWALAHAACRLLTRSDVVHFDGPRSVESAFTLDEVRALAQRAGLGGVRLQRCWPFRFVLTWQPASNPP